VHCRENNCITPKEFFWIFQNLYEHLATGRRSHKEIAFQLKIKESTSRSQLTKARAILKDLIIKNDLL